MEKKFRDNHVHFTGSLPIPFIFNAIRKMHWNDSSNLLEEWDTFFSDTTISQILKWENKDLLLQEKKFTNSIRSSFGIDKQRNFNFFFKAYELFQQICKKSYYRNNYELYRQGTISILEKNMKLGVTEVELIAGPKKTLNETIERINAMMEGLLEIEMKYNTQLENVIRLTYIRDSKTNKIINYSDEVLEFLLQKFQTDKKFQKLFSGFDFSGKENCEDTKCIIAIINKIRNIGNMQKGDKKLKISVHCGEDFFNNNYFCSIEFIKEIIQCDIDKICHGTILWMPKQYASEFLENNDKRQNILYEISRRNIEFELCPTANLMITPLENYRDINTALLKKLKISYTINSDNQTLFSTMLKNELKFVN